MASTEAVKKKTPYITPEHVLSAIYGKTSKQLRMSESRRDEVIAASIFASFRNQEFGTRLLLPSDYKIKHPEEDARGIDMVLSDQSGRRKRLQIKGIYLKRSIERRMQHRTKGTARVLGFRTQRMIKRDSEELTKIMKGELRKIVQDYSGLILIIHVIADLATQTSLEIAIKKSAGIVSNLKAKEVWFLRHVPVRAIHGRESAANCHAYKLIKITPDRHTYSFSFAL